MSNVSHEIVLFAAWFGFFLNFTREFIRIFLLFFVH